MISSIKLDKVRKIKFGALALDFLEDKGMDVFETLRKFENKGSIKDLCTLIQAGLIIDEQLEYKDVLRMIDEHSDIKTVTEELVKIIQKDFDLAGLEAEVSVSEDKKADEEIKNV
jgi:hypothetical protein